MQKDVDTILYALGWIEYQNVSMKLVWLQVAYNPSKNHLLH